MRDKTKPLTPGTEVEVQIERILPGGLGLAHAAGQTVLVGLAVPGDRLRVRVDRQRGSVAFASIVEVIEPSLSRVTPRCGYFGRCGGCDFQQLNYETQLAAKVEIILDCLRRIARLDYSGDIPIIPSPTAFHYRSSAQWKYDPVTNRVGYFERGSHTICDVVDCPILVPALQNVLTNLRQRMLDGSLPEEVFEYEAVAGAEGVSIFPAAHLESIREVSRNVGENRYRFSADSFFQTNQELLPSLIDAAMSDAEGETALDLYCGVGLFTLPLSRRFTQVIGVEGNSGAVDYARQNLAGASLSNATIVCATVGSWLRENAASIAPVDLILLDPPRTGTEKGVIDGILLARPRRISYVSCDPATLARDLRALIDGGYRFDSIVALDMFPQTYHVETVVRLSETNVGVPLPWQPAFLSITKTVAKILDIS